MPRPGPVAGNHLRPPSWDAAQGRNSLGKLCALLYYGVSGAIISVSMDQIGRYKIEQLIGRGGMGEVYRARDTLLGRTVAIKVFRTPEGVAPGEAASQRERLLREAQAAARLTHPNIVSVFDFAEEADIAYIVMELVEGETLAEFLARRT